MKRLPACLLVGLSLALAACAVDPEDLAPEDLPIVPDDELVLDSPAAAPDEPGLIAAAPVRRMCLYEGRDGNGRGSCWYTPAELNSCRAIGEIWRGADYCDPNGCLRNNTATSLYQNPAGDQIQVYLYQADHLIGTPYTVSDLRPQTHNLTDPFNNSISSAILCHWPPLS